MHLNEGTVLKNITEDKTYENYISTEAQLEYPYFK